MEDKQHPSEEVSIREYLDLFRRRKGIMVQAFVIVLVVGILVTFMTKPLYQSSATILVEGKSYNVTQLDASNPLNGLFTANSGHEVETQLGVIQGKRVVEETYNKARLPKGSIRFSARQDGKTDLINLSAESNTPLFTQRFLEALPAVYLNYVTGNRRTEIERALEFARQRLKEERGNLTAAQSAMQRFREKAGRPVDESERKERITDRIKAEAEYRQAKANVAGLKARLKELIARRNTQPRIQDTPVWTPNSQIKTIKEQIEVLRTQRAALTARYVATHPEVAKLDAQVAVLEGQLRQEPAFVESATRALNPTIAELDDRITEVRASLVLAEAQLAGATRSPAGGLELGPQFGSYERTQSELQREIDRHLTSATELTKTVDDLSMRLQATHDPVLVITPATAPLQIAPQKVSNLVYAAIVGLVLAFCFALLQEYLDDSVNSPEEATRVLGVPTLGYIPLVEQLDQRLLSDASGGNLLETFRVLRSNVQFSAVDTAIRSILVTSTGPGEGKSTTAYNLAVAMAMAGQQVILVDLDLRRPTVHELTGLDRRPGVTNVLVGHHPLADALRATEISGLRVLTTGPLPPNPAELCSSEAMAELMRELEGMADIVVFDSPPCLATADAQVLAANADGVLYVAQFGVTKRSAMRRAGELLGRANARMLGIVLNKIDLRSKRDDYYYGYYRYYHHYSTDTLDAGTRRRVSREYEALLNENGNGHGNGNGKRVLSPRKRVAAGKVAEQEIED